MTFGEDNKKNAGIVQAEQLKALIQTTKLKEGKRTTVRMKDEI